jgi:hypothetical protein
MNERRSIGRTKIAKDALLFFGEQTGMRSCGVMDITNAGAGIRTQDLPAIPLRFELSFDNFRTSRNCRLIWRDGDFVGVAFESWNQPCDKNAAHPQSQGKNHWLLASAANARITSMTTVAEISGR